MNILGFLILFVSIGISETLQTEWGECQLEIYDGRIEHIESINLLIHEKIQSMNDEFGPAMIRPFSIDITYDLEDFYKKAKGPVPEWGIAVAKRNPDRIVIQAPRVAGYSFSRLLEVLTHELNHIYMFRIPNSYTFPSWFKEGMAMREADEFSLKHRIDISNAKWRNQLFPIQSLEHFSGVKKSNATLAYGQSAAMIFALEYFYGNHIYKSILQFMREGMNFWDAIQSVTGEDRVDIKINFEIFLEDHYNLMFLLKTPNLLFSLLPLILIGGYFYKRHKNRVKLKAWEIEELLEDIDWDQGDHV